jgi:hypothetical protein
MKTLLKLTLVAILSVLSACASITPPEPDPSPQPSPVQPTGLYAIHELDQNGRSVREWTVTTYKHTLFPRSVSFKDEKGIVVTLTGSFEILIKQP